jgi:hypothetical protein
MIVALISGGPPALLARNFRGVIHIKVANIGEGVSILVASDQAVLSAVQYETLGSFLAWTGGYEIDSASGSVELNWVGDLWAVFPAGQLDPGVPIPVNLDLGQNQNIATPSPGNVAANNPAVLYARGRSQVTRLGRVGGGSPMGGSIGTPTFNTPLPSTTGGSIGGNTQK